MIRNVSVAFAALLALLAFSSAQAGEVARAVVTTGVVQREPVDDVATIPADAQRVIFFTDIRGMAGKTVTHVWKHNDEVMAKVDFKVGGPRWRVWSSKNLMPEWTGDWSVSVVDESGNQLAEKSFTYEAAAMTDDGKAEATGDAMSEEKAAPSDATENDKPMEAPAAEPMKDGE